MTENGEKASQHNEPVITVETNTGEMGGGKKTAKLVYTFFILLVYFVGGALKGQEGVTFLDLLIITDSDMERGSLLLTCSAVGFMLGPLLLGFLYDRYNNSGLFSLFIVASGVMTFAIPWCEHLILMSAAFVLRNLLTSAVDIGALVITVKLWKNEVNPYMQAIQAMFALGGIVSPLITAPFLSQTSLGDVHVYQDATENISITSRFEPIDTGDANASAEPSYDSTVPILTTSISNSTNSIPKEETYVYIAYSIIGASMLVVAVPITIMWLSQSTERLTRHSTTNQTVPEVEKTVHKPRRFKLLPVAIVLVGLFFFVYGPVEKTCANFLLSFLVKHLNWSKMHAAQGNSAFYAGFAGGRFVGIALAVVMPTTLMLFVFMIALVVCLGLFVLAVDESAMFVWVCIVLIGIAMSTIYASMYAWVDVNVTPVTGKMASCMQVTLALGTIATTPLIAYLFEEHTPLWFLYLTITMSSICLVSYSLLYGLSVKFPLRTDITAETAVFLNGDRDEKTSV